MKREEGLENKTESKWRTGGGGVFGSYVNNASSGSNTYSA
jgi:hypothetical protein